MPENKKMSMREMMDAACEPEKKMDEMKRKVGEKSHDKMDEE